MTGVNGVKVATFGGVVGMTRWDAFKGWVTRVRRHVGYRLIRPELDSYIEHYRRDAERDGWDASTRAWCAWHALTNLRDWVSGPEGWGR